MNTSKVFSVLCDCSGSMIGMKGTILESLSHSLPLLNTHYSSAEIVFYNSQEKKEVHFTTLDNPDISPLRTFNFDSNSNLFDTITDYLNSIITQKATGDDTHYSLLVLGDGSDNASSHYHKVDVKNAITELKKNGLLEVYYMSTSADFERDAESLGINPDHTIHFTFTNEGIKHAILNGTQFFLELKKPKVH